MTYQLTIWDDHRNPIPRYTHHKTLAEAHGAADEARGKGRYPYYRIEKIPAGSVLNGRTVDGELPPWLTH